MICVMREGAVPGMSEQIQQERLKRRARAAESAGRGGRMQPAAETG